jgi:RNA polymerase primary sigma factor
MHTEWMKNRTPEMNTQIIEAVQPIIDTAVQSYVGPNANQTARTQAKIMALRALETYDPSKGNVRTHLLSQMQSLRRYAAQQQNIIDIPEQVALDYQSLTEAENALRDKLGRGPTDDELADETGLSKRRITKIRSFNQPVSEGMTHNETMDGGDGTIASTIPGSDRGLDAWLDFVYDDLSSTDKLIMDMTLGRNGRKKASVQDIAKELNISPSAVSQRAAKIQEMIDKRQQYEVL